MKKSQNRSECLPLVTPTCTCRPSKRNKYNSGKLGCFRGCLQDTRMSLYQNEFISNPHKYICICLHGTDPKFRTRTSYTKMSSSQLLFNHVFLPCVHGTKFIFIQALVRNSFQYHVNDSLHFQKKKQPHVVHPHVQKFLTKKFLSFHLILVLFLLLLFLLFLEGQGG